MSAVLRSHRRCRGFSLKTFTRETSAAISADDLRALAPRVLAGAEAFCAQPLRSERSYQLQTPAAEVASLNSFQYFGVHAGRAALAPLASLPVLDLHDARAHVLAHCPAAGGRACLCARAAALAARVARFWLHVAGRCVVGPRLLLQTTRPPPLFARLPPRRLMATATVAVRRAVTAGSLGDTRCRSTFWTDWIIGARGFALWLLARSHGAHAILPQLGHSGEVACARPDLFRPSAYG